MLLNHYMLLLDGFNPNLVSPSNFDKASSKITCSQYKGTKGWQFVYSITAFGSEYILEDAVYYKWGVECMYAWKFESFQRVCFLQLLKRGYLISQPLDGTQPVLTPADARWIAPHVSSAI